MSGGRLRAVCCVLLLVLASVCLLPSPARGLNIVVPANDELCFFEELNKGEKMYASFAVQTGGYGDIDINVYDAEQKIAYEQEHAREGTLQLKAIASGRYKLCFSNSMSVVSDKVVSFNTYTGRSLLPLDAAKQEHLNPLEQQIVAVSESVYAVHDTQVYLKYREVRHIQTLDSTASRVVWLSLLELAGLCSVSVFNILFLRQLFERSGRK